MRSTAMKNAPDLDNPAFLVGQILLQRIVRRRFSPLVFADCLLRGQYGIARGTPADHPRLRISVKHRGMAKRERGHGIDLPAKPGVGSVRSIERGAGRRTASVISNITS